MNSVFPRNDDWNLRCIHCFVEPLPNTSLTDFEFAGHAEHFEVALGCIYSSQNVPYDLKKLWKREQ